MPFKINLREVVYSLSTALDYVGVDDIFHGKRVGFLSHLIAKEIGYLEEDINDIIFEGLLHDCGVSSTVTHAKLVNELDWENSHEHCVRGSKLLVENSFFQKYAPTIFYHHTHADSFPKHAENHTRERANIIYLADRIDIMIATGKRVDEVLKILETHRDSLFYSHLIDAFLKVLPNSDPINIIKDKNRVEIFFKSWIFKGKTKKMSYEDIKEIAFFFSKIVDGKSPFTREHSSGVASLSKHIAELLKLDLDSCQKAEISGFLHDLGKLKVPDEILHKRSGLTEAEREIINNHSEDGAKLLYKIHGFEEIAEYTALHHETLDNSGYPLHKGKEEIPLLARIIAVADIFQALAQNRPYRKGLKPKIIMKILKDMAEHNKIDSAILYIVDRNLDSCYKKALPEINSSIV
jgi:putative nucleotidyltransferase with HDIG domain